DAAHHGLAQSAYRHPGVQADETDDELDRRAIGEVRHLVVGQDAADDAFGAMAIAELIARLDRERVAQPFGRRRAEQDPILAGVRTPRDEGGEQAASAPEGR